MQRRFLAILITLGLASALASCATTPPPVQGSRPYPYAVTPVRPVADSSTSARIVEEDILDKAPETASPSGGEFDWNSELTLAPTTTAPQEEAVAKILILPAVAHVDQRLNVYAEKMSRWQPLSEQFTTLNLEDRRPIEWGECLAEVEQVFSGYSSLMELVLKAKDAPIDLNEVSVDPWQVYQEDIAYLDSGCDKVFVAGTAMVSGWLDRYSASALEESEAVVGEYAEKGQYADAVVAYQNMLASYPDKQAGIETRRIYGLALLRTGNLEGAVAVLSEVVADMPPSHEQRSVNRLVADLLLVTGEYEEALGQYKRLNDFYTSRQGDDRWVADQVALLGGVDGSGPELPLFRQILAAYTIFDGRHMPENMRINVDKLADEYIASPFVYRAQAMLREVEDKVRGWFGNRLVLVDELVDKKEFEQAIKVLDDVLGEDMSPGMRDVAQKTMDDVVLAKSQAEEMQRVVVEESQSAQWDKAENLFGMQKYDEAIAAFSALYGTDYEEKAREQVTKAINLSATETRRQAASLFVKARKTNDYDRKKELFTESWQLLKQIIEKYPNADIINKVRQNLKILEEQFAIFDPDLFNEISTPPLPEVDPADPALLNSTPGMEMPDAVPVLNGTRPEDTVSIGTVPINRLPDEPVPSTGGTVPQQSLPIYPDGLDIGSRP